MCGKNWCSREQSLPHYLIGILNQSQYTAICIEVGRLLKQQQQQHKTPFIVLVVLFHDFLLHRRAREDEEPRFGIHREADNDLAINMPAALVSCNCPSQQHNH